MTEARSQSNFLLTPAQHRAWAENARKVGRPDLAKHHEQLARAIEIIESRGQAVGGTVAP
jgi:propanediol dehydratase small subunit